MALIGVAGSIVSMGSFDPFLSDPHHGYFSAVAKCGEDTPKQPAMLPNATTHPSQEISTLYHPSMLGHAQPTPSYPACSPPSPNGPSTSPAVAGKRRSSSPASTRSAGSKRKAPAGDDAELLDDEAQAALKRQRNTMAARKYRQKRLDRIADLERALEEMTSERDGLKIQLARKEAEVDALREVMRR